MQTIVPQAYHRLPTTVFDVLAQAYRFLATLSTGKIYATAGSGGRRQIRYFLRQRRVEAAATLLDEPKMESRRVGDCLDVVVWA